MGVRRTRKYAEQPKNGRPKRELLLLLFPRLLPSEPMLLANLRIYFADFPECTLLYVPEHFMLGDLMR